MTELSEVVLLDDVHKAVSAPANHPRGEEEGLINIITTPHLQGIATIS